MPSSPRPRTFSSGCPWGPYALVIEGEAGIGKTTVWLEAVRLAEASVCSRHGRLDAAPSDLVGTAFDEMRTMLPAVQQRALASALLRAEPDSSRESRQLA
jgi:adenylate kinase